MKSTIVCCSILSLAASSTAGQDETLLLHQPTISADHVAFVYAENIWIVNRDGGVGRRLTRNPGREYSPRFSPAGTTP